MTTEFGIGHTRRTLFSTWRVQHYERRSVTFPFGMGFGCGQTVKVAQGYKQSLQTQLKTTRQLGFKLPGPLELSATTSVEESVTIGYEFTSTLEWSYTALPCEYCTPEIVFPDASITVWSKRPLHLPVFVSRITDFNPGVTAQIVGNCQKDPQRCHNCPDITEGLGSNPILSAPYPGGTSQIHRVILAERFLSGDALDLLDGLNVAEPSQIYFVGLDERLSNPAVHGPTLISIDEIDRSLGVVRLSHTWNRLYFLVSDDQTAEHPTTGEPLVRVKTVEDSDVYVYSEVVSSIDSLSALQLQLVVVHLNFQDMALEESRDVKLSVRSGGSVHEWPAVVLPSKSLPIAQHLVHEARTTAEQVEGPTTTMESAG